MSATTIERARTYLRETKHTPGLIAGEARDIIAGLLGCLHEPTESDAERDDRERQAAFREAALAGERPSFEEAIDAGADMVAIDAADDSDAIIGDVIIRAAIALHAREGAACSSRS
jgi:hypothetical protein